MTTKATGCGLVGKTLKENERRYVYVERKNAFGGYDTCDFLAEAGGCPGARVYAIGEHAENVDGAWLATLKPAEPEVAAEVAYRDAYQEAYYAEWEAACERDPKGDPRELSHLAAAAARAATGELRALMYA